MRILFLVVCLAAVGMGYWMDSVLKSCDSFMSITYTPAPFYHTEVLMVYNKQSGRVCRVTGWTSSGQGFDTNDPDTLKADK